MSFSVRILGSGSAVPTARRNPTSQYIQCSSRHILIDCGEGTQLQMRKFGVKFQKLDIILISHLHGDHYFGLMGLLSTMHLLGRLKELLIFGPKGLKEIVDLQLKHGNGGFGYDIVFKEMDSNTHDMLFEDNKIAIRCFPLKHKISTHGFTITEKQKEAKLIKAKIEQDNVLVEHYHLLKKGIDVQLEDGNILRSEDYTEPAPNAKVYAFCSDTAYFPEVVNEFLGADILYHEATFTDKYVDRAKATMHSTASEAANIAVRSAVKKLLIGHISARFDTGETHLLEARRVFTETYLAEDGDEIRL